MTEKPVDPAAPLTNDDEDADDEDPRATPGKGILTAEAAEVLIGKETA